MGRDQTFVALAGMSCICSALGVVALWGPAHAGLVSITTLLVVAAACVVSGVLYALLLRRHSG
jgi:hypothetical protein